MKHTLTTLAIAISISACSVTLPVTKKLIDVYYIETTRAEADKIESRFRNSDTYYEYIGKYTNDTVYLQFDAKDLNKRYGFLNHKRVIKKKYELLNEPK